MMPSGILPGIKKIIQLERLEMGFFSYAISRAKASTLSFPHQISWTSLPLSPKNPLNSAQRYFSISFINYSETYEASVYSKVSIKF